MEYNNICVICGKQFVNNRQNKTCGEECRRAWRRIRCNEYDKKCAEAKRAKKAKKQSLVNMAVAARQAGMTYGQYVAQSYLRKENDLV